eukprot:scaffold13090_cov122-Isochrysis_galbana.AAC.5
MLGAPRAPPPPVFGRPASSSPPVFGRPACSAPRADTGGGPSLGFPAPQCAGALGPSPAEPWGNAEGPGCEEAGCEELRCEELRCDEIRCDEAGCEEAGCEDAGCEAPLRLVGWCGAPGRAAPLKGGAA